MRSSNFCSFVIKLIVNDDEVSDDKVSELSLKAKDVCLHVSKGETEEFLKNWNNIQNWEKGKFTWEAANSAVLS